MDTATKRKILTGSTEEVPVEKIKIGDIVNLCSDMTGNILVVDISNNSIKKIFVKGKEATSMVLKKGNVFSVVNTDEFLGCFAQVVSTESKDKKSPIILKFKESVFNTKEMSFARNKGKIKRLKN